jgi:hypothetical protein
VSVENGEPVKEDWHSRQEGEAMIEQERKYKAEEGEWGWLPHEPCRYCREVGGVMFLRDEGPEGISGLSPVRCNNCKRSWVPGESSA